MTCEYDTHSFQYATTATVDSKEEAAAILRFFHVELDWKWKDCDHLTLMEMWVEDGSGYDRSAIYGYPSRQGAYMLQFRSWDYDHAEQVDLLERARSRYFLGVPSKG